MGGVYKHFLPRGPTICRLAKECVYRADRICDDPRTNKGNGDAACHRMRGRTILGYLGEPNSLTAGESHD